MQKLTLSNAKSLRELIHASVKSSGEQRVLLRLCCMLLIAEGCDCCEVARWFGEDPRTIERWVHAFDEHGVEGLREHHAGGRPAKLAGEQMQRLVLELKYPPRRCGYRERQWSGNLLAKRLESCYGIKLSPRQCQRMMRRLVANKEPLAP